MGNCENLLSQEALEAIGDALAERVRPAVQEALEEKFHCDRLLTCEVPAMQCGRGLFQELRVELRGCMPEFYRQCNFDRLIRICPFDPAWDAFDWKQKVVSERLQALEVQVKELEAKLPAKK